MGVNGAHNYNSYCGLMLFEHPLLVSQPQDWLSWDSLYHILLYHLSRYVTRPSLDDKDDGDEKDMEDQDSIPKPGHVAGAAPGTLDQSRLGPALESQVRAGPLWTILLDHHTGPREHSTNICFTQQTVNSKGTSHCSNLNEDTHAQRTLPSTGSQRWKSVTTSVTRWRLRAT